MTDRNLNLACIGNSAFSALIDERGQVVWSCMPRFDGDPMFGSLVMRSNTSTNDMGFFDIVMTSSKSCTQSFHRNSSVLSTKLTDSNGSVLEVVDFVPRYTADERDFRPNMMIRILRPVEGTPRASIRLRPTFGYGWGIPEKTRGSNHIRYLLSNMTIRLTTNVPVSYIIDEVAFDIDQAYYLFLMPDESLQQTLHEFATVALDRTSNFWESYAQRLTVPFEWQDQVIRAAITLKMLNYDETGAFVEALTTSIPTSAGETQNIDQRYCSIQEAHSLTTVLNLMSDIKTMEKYLVFLSNVVALFENSGEGESRRMQPVYGIAQETRLYEKTVHRLPGYRGMGPVTIGSKIASEVHLDALGAVIVSLTHVFFDARFVHMNGDKILFERLEQLGASAAACYDKPSNRRTRVQDPAHQGEDGHTVQTYSAVMCWAACDRLAIIARKLQRADREAYWSQTAQKIRADILKRAWNASLGSFTSEFDGSDVDAYLLRLSCVRFVEATDERFVSTVALVEKKLRHGAYLRQFSTDRNARIAATFWLIEAWAEVGRTDEARRLFEKILSVAMHNGILSATIDPNSDELWGNYPEQNSLVGLIRCAFKLSKPWEGSF